MGNCGSSPNQAANFQDLGTPKTLGTGAQQSTAVPQGARPFPTNAPPVHKLPDIDTVALDQTSQIRSNHICKQQATAHFNKGEYQLAITLFGQAIGQDADDDDLYHARAACFYRTGQGMEGLRDIQKLSLAQSRSAHALETQVLILQQMQETLDFFLMAHEAAVAYPWNGALQSLLLESRLAYERSRLFPPLDILETVVGSLSQPSRDAKLLSIRIHHDASSTNSKQIYLAIQNDDLVGLRKLVYSGISVNLPGPYPGLSPATLFATALARWSCLDFLLAQGGDIEARMYGSADGHTPLMLAVCGSCAPNRILETLLRHRADVHAVCRGSSPLISVQRRASLGLGNQAMYALLERYNKKP